MTPFAIAVFDIDGVIRDVGGSYRRAIADTVEHYTQGSYRPTIEDIDQLKSEGIWNNDWRASEAMIHRYCERQNQPQPKASYEEITDFFQKRYRGPDTEDPNQWTGYIADEPLLVDADHLQTLKGSGVPYAFFSGATQGSASFVLQRRIGLSNPLLVAMEDAPSKPDPTGLMVAVQLVETQLSAHPRVDRAIAAQASAYQAAEKLPVMYAGDTAADMKTIIAARSQFPDRDWLAVGILPPHAQQSVSYQADYESQLKAAGADIVLTHVRQMTAELIRQILP